MEQFKAIEEREQRSQSVIAFQVLRKRFDQRALALDLWSVERNAGAARARAPFSTFAIARRLSGCRDPHRQRSDVHEEGVQSFVTTF
jgi:hypothetical protein